MLTLLATDGTPGLQIRLNDRWMEVPSLPGTFVCNVGDMLERWTNGMFRSIVHRVRALNIYALKPQNLSTVGFS